METLTVNLGDRSYPIYTSAGLLLRTGELLRRAGLDGKAAVVTNPQIADLYFDRVARSLTDAGFQVVPILIPAGEEHKNIETMAMIYDRLIDMRLERKSCVVALGGGVIGDLAGFAAATYLRGVPYVQMPTTLLAQVDSSVGGKTGINHRTGKNLIGAFYQPRAVLIDVDVLVSLPRRELIAGLAEVIKYGVIADRQLFGVLEERMERLMDLDPEILTQIIARSCAIKARVVEVDEREDDNRAVLNFGHTLGHALEAATNYRTLLHGEAVGVGMAKAAMISWRHGYCDEQSVQRIRSLIQRTGLPVDLPRDLSKKTLIEAMEVDKKSADGKIRFVMCGGIGKTYFHYLSPAQVLAALNDSPN